MIAILLLFVSFGLGALAGVPNAGAAVADSTSADTTAAARALRPLPHWMLGDSIVWLPEVHVERERPRSDARRRAPTAFVSEFRAGEAGRALETVAEVLEQAAGVRVVQYGGLGSFSTVSVRGSPANQVALYLDGAPLTSAAHGVVSLADLPATAIERIEVYRGVSPLSLGAAAAGGAINLVTLSAAGTSEVRTARGTWDTWESRGSWTGTRGPLSGLLHFGYQSSRGDFDYEDDNGTPFNAADDSVSRRLNNRFDGATALAGLTWRPVPGLRIGAREDLFQKIQGVPGLGQVPALHPRLAFLRSLSQLDATWDARGPWPELRARGSYQHERTRFRDTEAELGLGRHDTDDRVAGAGAGLELAWPRLPAGFALRAAGDLRDDRARPADAADGFPDPPESRRRGSGAVAGLEWRPAGEDVVLTLARRWDRFTDRLRANGVAGSHVSQDVAREIQTPQVGLAMQGPFGIATRANWTRTDRVPDFLELFGNQGSVLGNPALQPEHVESWDAGLGWETPAALRIRGGLEWAHFESHARDLVVYVRNSQSSVRAQNISRSTIAGDELTVRASGPLGLTASGSFTWQAAVDHGPVPFWNGKRLPQHPAREGSARLEWRRAELPALGSHVSDVRIGGTLDLLGDNYLDRYNRQRVASRTLVGASASFSPFVHALRLTVEGKNLGNRRVSDVAGFPLPGRSLFVACEWRARTTSFDSTP